MHFLNRMIPAVVVLILISAFAVYANGQGEATKLSGSILTISPPNANGQVSIELNGKAGTYSITVDQSLVADAGLSPDKSIDVTGVVHDSTDGTKTVDPTEIDVDGHKYTISQPTGATSGNPPVITEASHNSSTNDSTTVEKPHNSPDKSASASHDSETPDTSKG